MMSWLGGRWIYSEEIKKKVQQYQRVWQAQNREDVMLLHGLCKELIEAG